MSKIIDYNTRHISAEFWLKFTKVQNRSAYVWFCCLYHRIQIDDLDVFPYPFCEHRFFVYVQVAKIVIKGRTSKHVNSYVNSNFRIPAVSTTSNATYSKYVHVLRTCTYARDRLRRSARTPVTRVHQVERPMTDVILAWHSPLQRGKGTILLFKRRGRSPFPVFTGKGKGHHIPF